MIKSAQLLALLALFSLQLVVLSQEFLPLPTVDDINIDIDINEEASLEEANEEGAWDWEENNLEFNGEEAEWILTAETAGQAISGVEPISENIGSAEGNAAAQIVTAISGQASTIGDTVAANSKPEAGPVVTELVQSVGNSASDVEKVVGDAATTATDAFRDAKNNGGDSGAAVGSLITDALSNVDGSDADDAVDDAIENAVANSNAAVDLSDAADEVSNAVDRGVDAARENADEIGDAVATQLNNASAQTEDTAQVVGLAVGGLVQDAKNNADQIGDIAQSSDLAAGITNSVTTPEQVTAGVTDAMNAATAGTQANSENFNTMIGNVAQDLGNNIATHVNRLRP